MTRNFPKAVIFSFLLFSIVLSACSEPTPAPTLPVSAISTNASPAPAASPESQDVTQTCEPTNGAEETEISDQRTVYGMEISLNYTEHQLMVEQAIDYTNTTNAEIGLLPLLVPPASKEGVFALIDLQLPEPFTQSSYQVQGPQVSINLAPSLPPDASLQIHLIYHLELPQSQSVLGYTDRQLTLADWYPFIPPYIEGEGWLVNEPGQVGEYLVYPLANFFVNLHLSDPMDALVIASSVPVTAQEGNCWRYEARGARNIVFALSPEYQIAAADGENVTIQAYTLPEHSQLGQRAADLALAAWSRYETLYGPNSRHYMSIIEADLIDGMEYDGAYFISDWYYETTDETPGNYFSLLTVHETAHQWFYAQVPNDPAGEPWLDEALATYSELLFLESAHPEWIAWWWDFRVAEYNPAGYVDSTIYTHHEYRPYVNAVYLRGALFLQDLRDAIGDEAFFSFLHAYAMPDEADTIRTKTMFFTLLSAYSDADLTDLRRIYFRSAQP